jgi:hypothetical protein
MTQTTTKADIEKVRELLNHPAFEDMPRNFQIKVIMASESFERLAEVIDHYVPKVS